MSLPFFQCFLLRDVQDEIPNGPMVQYTSFSFPLRQPSHLLVSLCVSSREREEPCDVVVSVLFFLSYLFFLSFVIPQMPKKKAAVYDLKDSEWMA